MYMYADGCGSHIWWCTCMRMDEDHISDDVHVCGDCSWCGYLPSLDDVHVCGWMRITYLRCLPTSTTVVLKRRGDCSWCGYLPSLVVVGMKALESLPTSTTIVLNKEKQDISEWRQSVVRRSGHWSNPACHSRSIHCLFRRLTCPNVCQSSRSLKRSVLFRWMIRWRLDWLQKSNMNYVCREHVSEPHHQRQLHTCVQVINKPKILLIPGHVKYMQYLHVLYNLPRQQKIVRSSTHYTYLTFSFSFSITHWKWRDSVGKHLAQAVPLI